MNEMANECFKSCAQQRIHVKGPDDDNSESLLSSQDIEFNKLEETCIDNCVLRIKHIDGLMERHINEQFNPIFVSKYV